MRNARKKQKLHKTKRAVDLCTRALLHRRLLLQPRAGDDVKEDPKVISAHVQRRLAHVVQQKLTRYDRPGPHDTAGQAQKQPPNTPFFNNSGNGARN